MVFTLNDIVQKVPSTSLDLLDFIKYTTYMHVIHMRISIKMPITGYLFYIRMYVDIIESLDSIYLFKFYVNYLFVYTFHFVNMYTKKSIN